MTVNYRVGQYVDKSLLALLDKLGILCGLESGHPVLNLFASLTLGEL